MVQMRDNPNINAHNYSDLEEDSDDCENDSAAQDTDVTTP